MSKSIKILALYVYLLVFVQSLSSFDSVKEPLNPIQTQFKSNELKEYTDTFEINVKSEDNQNLIVGRYGTFIFTTRYRDEENIFNPESIEKETVLSFQSGNLHLIVALQGAHTYGRSFIIYAEIE